MRHFRGLWSMGIRSVGAVLKLWPGARGTVLGCFSLGGSDMENDCCICYRKPGRFRLSQNMEATMRYDGPQYHLWVCSMRCLRAAVTVILGLTDSGPTIDFGPADEEE